MLLWRCKWAAGAIRVSFRKRCVRVISGAGDRNQSQTGITNREFFILFYFIYVTGKSCTGFRYGLIDLQGEHAHHDYNLRMGMGTTIRTLMLVRKEGKA